MENLSKMSKRIWDLQIWARRITTSATTTTTSSRGRRQGHNLTFGQNIPNHPTRIDIYHLQTVQTRSLTIYVAKTQNKKAQLSSTQNKEKPQEDESGVEKTTTREEQEEHEEQEHEDKIREGSESGLVGRLRKERRRISDLILKKSPEQELKEKKRYEIDVPPVEEERHKYWKSRPLRSVNKELIKTSFFENIKDKNKFSFMAGLEIFAERDVHLRGHVEFIYAALGQMIKFGIHRDLDAYKKIIDVFPKGKMISSNMFQVEFMHYPKQQQCAIDILEQMENYGVIPDTEVQQMLTNIFGSQSFPMRKAGRMLYWMPKFKNLSPWLLPDPLPDDSLELAKLAIKKITSIDLSTSISVFNTEELEDAYDPTWIVSGQSREQQELISSHPPNQPIYVEGAFRVWLSRVCINYFVLRAEPRPRPVPPSPMDEDDVSKLHSIFGEDYHEHMVVPVPSVHEQDDGIIFGVCATGTSSRDSVISWIRFLERTNPRLGKDIPILFTLKSPIGPTDDLEIPSFEEAQKLVQLSSGDEPNFSVSSGGKLGLDPRLPNLKQMGIWTESESVFPNWPHHHHPENSPSARNLAQNLQLVDELEENIQSKMKRSSIENQASPPPTESVSHEQGSKQIK